jgi:hypothetical protein
MRAEDVTDTLELALTASGCDSAKVLHKPRLLSDNVLRAEGNERTVKVSLFVSMLSPHDARQVA